MAVKSLGQLTLDLVAKVGGFIDGFDKAERRTKKSTEAIKKELGKAGKAFLAYSSAAVAASAAIAVSTINTATEITKLSRLSNTSAQEFQRFTAGTKLLGIENEKVADVLKDTSDRIGDFLQSGAGPLADFFENIAPKVGVTAEQFRNLSGADGLKLYVKSLEEANVSQNELTFFMEALSGQSTELLPLLRNDAKAMEAFADEAERTGKILSDETLASAQELQLTFKLFTQDTEAFKLQIGAKLLPTLQDLAGVFGDVAVEGSFASEIGDGIAKSLKAVTSVAVGAYTAVKLLAKGLATIAAASDAAGITAIDRAVPGLVFFKIAKNIDAVKGALSIGFEDIGDEAEKAASLINKIFDAGNDGNGGGDESDTETRVKKLIKLMKEANEVANGSAGEIGAKLFKEQEKALADYQKLLVDLQSDEEKLKNITLERIRLLEKISTISNEQRASLQGQVLSAGNVAPTFGGESDDFEGERKLLTNWYEEQITLLDDYAAKELAAENAIIDARFDLQAKYQERVNELEKTESEKRRQQQLDGYNIILDAAGEYFEGLEGKEAGYARAAISIGKALFDDKQREAIKSVLVNAQDAAFGAYKALSGIPVIGPALGSAAALAIIAAGAVATAKITGIAHDGLNSVPKTGTYLLEKNERVTTANTSAKLDNTLEMISKNQRATTNNNAMSITVNMTGGGGSERDTKMAGAQIAREINRVIGGARRYG